MSVARVPVKLFTVLSFRVVIAFLLMSIPMLLLLALAL